MQNYTIFNKNNKILIVKSCEKLKKTNEDKIIYCNSDNLRTINFRPLFEDNQYNDVIIFTTDISTEIVFQYAIKELKFVQAAGGIVQNEIGEYLFMYRNGFWDLPKGHKEKNETITKTAFREVIEECGMHELIQNELIGCTFHTYIMKGIREIKQTYWYDMFCSKKEQLIPQTEEGITKLEWINKNDINNILKQSYSSIQYLFNKIIKVNT